MTRAVVAIATALLLGIVVVRNAWVAEYAEVRPSRAVSAWPGHPDTELWSGLTAIAEAARTGRPVSSETMATLDDAARKAPLAAAPFLVRGIRARIANDERLAGEAFRAAEQRDGRSVPARYFLADHDLRTGDTAHGLHEISILAGMIPSGVAALAPFVAGYAHDPKNWPRLHDLFRSDPMLGSSVLATLATDPRNSDLVIRLAGGDVRPGIWSNQLIQTLVGAGNYAKAYQVWRQLAHVAGSGLVYDADFRDASAPGPFNWVLTSSALGLSERQVAGRLHVVYYGQDKGALASQVLVLKPGRYNLQMRVSGDPAGMLGWTVTCAESGLQLGRVPLSATVDRSFDVPSDCAAQRLDLEGWPADIARTVDVTITGFRLSQERTGG